MLELHCAAQLSSIPVSMPLRLTDKLSALLLSQLSTSTGNFAPAARCETVTCHEQVSCPLYGDVLLVRPQTEAARPLSFI